MLQKLPKRKSGGFTIIEVMIVLAIAGLILLIVFLAVPALQRNAHNTSLKADVAGLLGGVSEYVSNNNGSVPTVLANKQVNSVDLSGGAGTNVATVKLGYIDGTTGVSIQKAPNSNFANNVPIGQVALYYAAVCNGTGGTGLNATTRNVIALYTLEGGAGAKECQAT
jgi:prepilin-type N-terminal cleavage/methylation domain-containing protein